MINKHRAIAIIPARGGSKRIPRKNIVKIAGKPMIVYSILGAKKSSYLKDNIYVSTDHSQIAKISRQFGAQIIERPKKLSTDKTGTLPVLQHAIKKLEDEGIEFDTVVVLQSTSPFRKVETINLGISKLWNNWKKLDAVYSVTRTKFPPLWMLRLKGNILEFLYPNDFSKIREQDLEKTYEFDGVLFVLKKDLVAQSKLYPFSNGRTGYVETGKIESIDIDDIEGLEITKAIFKNR